MPDEPAAELPPPNLAPHPDRFSSFRRRKHFEKLAVGIITGLLLGIYMSWKHGGALFDQVRIIERSPLIAFAILLILGLMFGTIVEGALLRGQWRKSLTAGFWSGVNFSGTAAFVYLLALLRPMIGDTAATLVVGAGLGLAFVLELGVFD